MVEEYMLYQAMVYIIQYSPQIVASINVDLIWDVNSINKFEWEHLLGKCIMRKYRCKYMVYIYNTFDLVLLCM